MYRPVDSAHFIEELLQLLLLLLLLLLLSQHPRSHSSVRVLLNITIHDYDERSALTQHGSC